MDEETKMQIDHLIKDLIYHGRYFSKFRDEVVIKKANDYLLNLLERRDK